MTTQVLVQGGLTAAVVGVAYVWMALALGAVYRRVGGNPGSAWVPIARWVQMARVTQSGVGATAVARTFEALGLVAMVAAFATRDQLGDGASLLVVGAAAVYAVAALVAWILWIVHTHRLGLDHALPGGLVVVAALVPVIWASLVGWSSRFAPSGHSSAPVPAPLVERAPLRTGQIPVVAPAPVDDSPEPQEAAEEAPAAESPAVPESPDPTAEVPRVSEAAPATPFLGAAPIVPSRASLRPAGADEGDAPADDAVDADAPPAAPERPAPLTAEVPLSPYMQGGAASPPPVPAARPEQPASPISPYLRTGSIPVVPPAPVAEPESVEDEVQDALAESVEHEAPDASAEPVEDEVQDAPSEPAPSPETPPSPYVVSPLADAPVAEVPPAHSLAEQEPEPGEEPQLEPAPEVAPEPADEAADAPEPEPEAGPDAAPEPEPQADEDGASAFWASIVRSARDTDDNEPDTEAGDSHQDDDQAPAEDRAAGASSPEAAHDPELDDRTQVSARQREAWELVTGDGAVYPFDAATVVVGRRGLRPVAQAGGRVEISDATKTISKSHARLSLEGGRWTVEDLGSTNGTLLVGADGRERRVEAGTRAVVADVLLLGDVEVRIRRREG
ncbi:FHA domain-containing protein [Demequina pelophila]|uniref:FHA domain-containing protein n=1 Tax=Demequina pelophila TaxID=1638984 RepID=UPI000784C1AF|nr:FHA domain-containing protein [Demequina pelophila]